MNKSKKKGFTLVELVIVIAVIAVLAAILIPTFVTVVDNANFSSDIQAARNMSTVTKSAAINGPTDDTGKEMKNVSMSDPRCVIELLKANGYDLVPKSKGAAFWYDRATGDVKVLKNSEILGTAKSSGKTSANMGGATSVKMAENGVPTTFTQDCVEALSADNPSFVIIDQSEKNPLSVAVNSLYMLVVAATEASGATPTYSAVTTQMDTIFDRAITNNADLSKVLKMDGGSLSPTYSHLTSFSPDKCLYISSDGAYTSQPITSSMEFSNALFVKYLDKSNADRPVIKDSDTFGLSAELQGASLNFVDTSSKVSRPVTIPFSIVKFADGAMENFDPKTTVIANREYGDLAFAKSGCKAVIVDNTGKTQITYKNLTYGSFNYVQYGARYFEYRAGAQVSADTTTYVSSFDTLQKLSGPLQTTTLTGYGRPAAPALGSSYKQLQSIYAVPDITISNTLTDGTVVDLKPFLNQQVVMDFKYFSKNLGNLTVMYGSIIAGSEVYKIQEIAYIKAVSTYVISKIDGNYLVVSDPLAGGSYYNLQGLTVFAVDGSGNERVMERQNFGFSKGDYEISASGSTFTKIYIKDSVGKVILVQYL